MENIVRLSDKDLIGEVSPRGRRGWAFRLLTEVRWTDGFNSKGAAGLACLDKYMGRA